MIEEAGFTVDRVTYCNTAPYVPVLVTRKIKNLVNRLTRRQGDAERALQSDLGEVPGPINSALVALMRVETKLMRRFDFPFGVSILALASRPLDAAEWHDRPSSLDEHRLRAEVLVGAGAGNGTASMSPVVGAGDAAAPY